MVFFSIRKRYFYYLIFISLFISFDSVVNSPCGLSDFLDGEWIYSGNLESTNWTHFPLTHDWTINNQWEIKYHESHDRGNNCEDYVDQYLEAKFVLRNKSYCELWDYVKSVKFTSSYFDKIYGSKKINIFVVGDSLGGQYAITSKLVSEVYNLTDIVNVEFIHDHTLRNDVPCHPNCVNTEFREKKITACAKCLQNYSIDTFQVSSPNFFLNRIPIGTNVLFLSTGIWYNNLKMADNLDYQSYESTLHLIAPLLKLLVDRGLVIVWIELPYRSNWEEDVPPNPLYEWESFQGKDYLAKIVFNNTGIIFANYNSAIKLRKEKDPKIFKKGGVHYCLPGLTGASNFLIENIMQSIASSLYHKLEKNYNILCPKKSTKINNETFELNSCWS